MIRHGIHWCFTNCFVFWKVFIRVQLTIIRILPWISRHCGLTPIGLSKKVWSDDPLPVGWISPTSFNSFSKTFSQPDISISDFIFSTSASNSGWTVALTMTHWDDGRRVLLKNIKFRPIKCGPGIHSPISLLAPKVRVRKSLTKDLKSYLILFPELYWNAEQQSFTLSSNLHFRAIAWSVFTIWWHWKICWRRNILVTSLRY